MWELFMAKEALASCQIEGIATEMTLRDYFIARLEAEEKAERAERRRLKRERGTP